LESQAGRNATRNGVMDAVADSIVANTENLSPQELHEINALE
jgi:hypothetical protein